MAQIKRIIIHHSKSKPSTTIEEIRSWHTDPKDPPEGQPKGNGWSDIGYHWVFGEDCFYNGRPETRTGAHTGGYNTGSLGVCVTGNFEEEEISDERFDMLIKFLIGKFSQFSLGWKDVFTHQEFGNTLCPGKHLHNRLVRYRDNKLKEA